MLGALIQVPGSVLVMLIVFDILGLLVALALFGTLYKSRWGINVDSVSCPRCKTPLPRFYGPRSLRQALWGGWTCPICGAGVDKWGREVPPTAPRAIVRSEQDTCKSNTRRRMLGIVFLFCAIMSIDLFGFVRKGFPLGWQIGLVVEALHGLIAIAAVSVPLYFISRALHKERK